MQKRKLKTMVELKEFLKNPSPKLKVPVYTEEENKQGTTDSGDDIVKKPTLSQRMDRLETRIDQLAKIVSDGFKQVNGRIDNLEKDVNSLKQDVKGINARLDYNSLQIERIEKRLDYNGLKKLPESR